MREMSRARLPCHSTMPRAVSSLIPPALPISVTHWSSSKAALSAEAIANVLVGYGLAVLTQILVFPLFGLRTTLSENLAMGLVFTIVSLAAPGILAGALLSFTLSFDDYIITSFNAGSTVTFPLWVYGASRVGVPPQVNVMGTIIFVGGVLLAVLNGVLASRRKV